MASTAQILYIRRIGEGGWLYAIVGYGSIRFLSMNCETPKELDGWQDERHETCKGSEENPTIGIRESWQPGRLQLSVQEAKGSGEQLSKIWQLFNVGAVELKQGILFIGFDHPLR